MAKFGTERFPENYQNAVGIHARDFLHKNSKELVSILNEAKVLRDNLKIFEIGAAGGRNLKYILDENESMKLFANDLFEAQSRANMDPKVKENITFFEGDTEDVVRKNNELGIDLFLSSDHLMHLQYEKADFIIKHVCDVWKPEYVLLREIKKEYETPEHPRLFHNYDYFNNAYSIVSEKISDQAKEYFIRLLKKNKI